MVFFDGADLQICGWVLCRILTASLLKFFDLFQYFGGFADDFAVHAEACYTSCDEAYGRSDAEVDGGH